MTLSIEILYKVHKNQKLNYKKSKNKYENFVIKNKNGE